MLCLNIRQKPAIVEVSATRAIFEMKATPAQIRIDTQAATVEIHQAPGRLTIDNTPFRASYGIKTAEEFARDNAELGRRTVLATIGRLAQEGDRMAKVESGENAIAALAAEAGSPDPPELTLASLEPPLIRYQAVPVEFNPRPGSVRIDVVPGKVDGRYTPGKVSGTVKQYQSVRFWVTENQYDIYA